jgi:predicted molibdopterin-dependent oxidoreductase YjgC
MMLEASTVAGSTATIDDLRAADTIVWAGPDPKEVLPVLYLHLHAAVRDRGARVIVASSRRISLSDLGVESVRLTPGEEASAFDGLAPLEGKTVVCWSPTSPGRDDSALLRALLQLGGSADAKFLICPPHAGSQGMLDMGVHPGLDAGYKVAPERGRDTRAILEAAAAGELDALLLFGADPIADFPDADLARRALEASSFTVAVELFPTESALLADVLLPSAAYAEREGTFTNLERRLQKLEPLIPPPGSSREPWRAAAGIARALGDDWGWSSFADVWTDICKNVPTHADLDVTRLAQEATLPAPYDSSGFAPDNSLNPLQIAGPGGQYPKGHRQGAPFQTGQNWPLSWELRAFEAKQRPGFIPVSAEAASGDALVTDTGSAGDPGDGDMQLLTGRFIYDEGTMVSRTAHLRSLQRRPFVELNDEDAKELGIADGDQVVVSGAGNEVTLPAVVNGISRGCVFVPYDQMDLRANTLISGINPTVTVRKADT